VVKKIVFILLLVFVGAFAEDLEPKKEVNLKSYEVKNTTETKTKESMQDWLNAGFGLKPYKTNYLLPYGYRDGKYKSYIQSDKYTNKEAEIQISLKLYLGHGLLGLNERYYISYTHQAFWQIYADSSPFRETTYNPEAFVIFPILDDSFLQMSSLKFAVAHRSNGQGNNENAVFVSSADDLGNRSRSINYFYTTLSLQHDTLITDLSVWAPFPGSTTLDDNPDLMDYIGYGSVKFSYLMNKQMFTLMGRANLATGNGAVEATYSYPLLDDVYLYGKIFSGYAESLIDYNNYITKFSIGFSFSR
jgi:phospholipase A1